MSNTQNTDPDADSLDNIPPTPTSDPSSAVGDAMGNVLGPVDDP
jgi:hypothetical protein